MGNLLKLLASLFVILFFVGVAWLAYGSYQHMKNKSLHSSVEKTETELSETDDERLADDAEFDDEDEFIDDDEDLLEDDEVDELLASEDDVNVLDEIENSVMESEEEAEQLASNAKDKLNNGASSLASAGAATLDKTKAGVSDVADKAKAGVSEFTEKSAKAIVKPEGNDIPKSYDKAVNLSPKDMFFVITGSFTIAENAENEAKAMRKKGYTDAETVQFASTKYLSVCVGRFSNSADARKMVANIKKDSKLDAYVHKRRMK